MFPVINIFGNEISTYSTMALVGAFTSGPFAILALKKRTGDGYPMLATLLYAAIGILLGGGLLYGITNINYWYLLFSASDFGQWFQSAQAIFGGSVFYGGLLGGMAVGFFVMKKRKYPTTLMSDICAPAAALFHAFGRIGCFLGGCCYGVESDFGFTFTHSPNLTANGVRRLPVQLFEAGFEFMLFFALWLLLRKEKLKGRLFTVYLFFYGIFRFIIEFWRGDTYRGFVLGLSTSQFISALIVPAALIAFIVLSRKKRETDTPENTASE